MKNKKGQFFLLAAVIIVSVIISLTFTINYAESVTKYPRLQEQTNSLKTEIVNIVAYSMYSTNPVITKEETQDRIDLLVEETANAYWGSSNTYVEVGTGTVEHCANVLDGYHKEIQFNNIEIGPNYILTAEGQALRAEKILDHEITDTCLYVFVMIEDKDSVYVAIA